jgi:hypothetical protein
MWKTDLRIELADEERQDLQRLDRSLIAPHRAVVRARTILWLATGLTVSAVARQVGRGRRIVRKWGVHRSGRPPRFCHRSGHALSEADVRAA